MMKRLNEKMEDVLDDLGWFVGYPDEETVEIENYSPLGEDIFEDISLATFSEDIQEISDRFDVDEHVEKLIIAKNNGVRGIPNSIQDLLDDAKAIKKMYADLAAAVKAAEKKEGK